MLQLDLTPEEQQIMIGVLESYVADLRMEIADTDRVDYKQMLKERKQVVNKVLTALRLPEPSGPMA